jgi:hypothetical protein
MTKRGVSAHTKCLQAAWGLLHCDNMTLDMAQRLGPI